MRMSERDARGPEDNDKAGFILGGSASSPVENWSGARPAKDSQAVAFKLIPAWRISATIFLRLPSRSIAAVASTTTATSKPA